MTQMLSSTMCSSQTLINNFAVFLDSGSDFCTVCPKGDYGIFKKSASALLGSGLRT